MKTGLVLEGGAMRGLFSAGVIDVLMENGVRFDGLIGVSAGAVFGCNYKSGQIGRTIRYNMRFCKDKQYCSFRSLLKTGDLFGAEYCYHTLPRELDVFDNAAFMQNPMKFYTLCTDVESGQAVVHDCLSCDDRDLEWMRGSASMPLAARIVEVDGYKLLDGGIADSIPLRRFEDMGYERNVVILTQPRGYTKKPNRLMPILRHVYRAYPHLIHTLAHRHENYNASLAYVARREHAGHALVIRPDAPLEIGHTCHDAAEMKRVYDLGRQMGLKRLEEIRRFLNTDLVR
ncbi:MAG: patatin family protein [Clostridiales bacterium]|nr:patatin family protein [Clostridiales bacterium]